MSYISIVSNNDRRYGVDHDYDVVEKPKTRLRQRLLRIREEAGHFHKRLRDTIAEAAVQGFEFRISGGEGEEETTLFQGHNQFLHLRFREGDDPESIQALVEKCLRGDPDDTDISIGGVDIAQVKPDKLKAKKEVQRNHQGRPILSPVAWDAIRARADRVFDLNRRILSRDEDAPNQFATLRLRPEDRLAILPNGKTLESALLQRAAQKSSPLLMEGLYTVERPFHPRGHDYIHEVTPARRYASTLQGRLARDLNESLLAQPSQLIEAVFLPEDGGYILEPVKEKSLRVGDICIFVIEPSVSPRWRKPIVEDGIFPDTVVYPVVIIERPTEETLVGKFPIIVKARSTGAIFPDAGKGRSLSCTVLHEPQEIGIFATGDRKLLYERNIRGDEVKVRQLAGGVLPKHLDQLRPHAIFKVVAKPKNNDNP